MKILLHKFKLFTFIMLLFAFSANVKAATITSTATGGNWSATTTWVGGVVPLSSDNVTVVSGSTVTIDVNAEAKTISVSGILSFNDGIRLTVSGDVIVNSGGSFEILKENGSQAIATLIVYGNYNNNGSTNFWKGSVVIAGNLVSSTTSTIQNNGNVVVGGNIIGSFDTTGGDGSGQIYAVDPNAIVTITPATIDGNVIPGVFPSTESPTLIDLVNLVIYGGACSFIINDISSVSACSGSNAVFTVTTNGSSPSYQWQANKNDGSGWVDLTGQTSASLSLSGVDITMNNYKYRAKITAGSPSCTKNGDYGVLMVNTTNTWNGTSWSSGSSTLGKNIVFSGNYSSTSDLSGCSCQVTSGNVVINSGNTLTITKEVNVSGGSLTFKDKSSLVQINNATNSGNITYQRMTNTNVLNTDFTYWSSPVAPQTLYNLSPKTLSSQFFSYEVTATAEDWKQESSAITMTIGKGYIVRGPESTSSLPPPPGFYQASFYGVPNNGDYTITGIYADKSYLLGNPYPSALDADTFLNDNAGVLNGTLYFWTHNTALSPAGDISDPGSGLLAYSSNDYASYNITGGVGIAADDITAAAPSGSTGGANISIPSGKIAAGQGFFGSSKTTITGTNGIVFNNSMRLDNSGNTLDNSQFFKLNNTKAKTTKTIEKHRIWLNLTNSQGAFKQTLVGYITDATNEFDNRFDGESFDGNEFVDFYSVNQDKNLVIQGRALPFDENDEVPLGFRSTIEGTFTILIDQTDGLLRNQAVFIEDKLTNTTFDLKSGDYTFTTVAGTFNERFVLRYTNKNAKTLSAADFSTQENPVLVSNRNKQIRINSAEEMIDKVLVYDIAGKQIYHKTNVSSNEFSISNLVSSHQVLLVKTSLQNGRTVTNKIIY